MDSSMTALDNEDWIKYTRWDLYRVGEQIVTVDNLLWALNVQTESLEQQKKALVDFTNLPAWHAAPDGLVAEVADFLTSIKASIDDEPRDDHGRWTSDGGGDDTASPTPTPSGDLAKMTPDELSAHMADVNARQQVGMSKGMDTLHTDDMIDGIEGKYTVERQEQQQKVIDGFVNKPGVESNHQLVVMAGLPGAGKTTFLNGHVQELGIDPKSYVDVNPDDVGAAMQAAGMVPDYSSLGLSPQETGTLIQEEKSYVAAKVALQAAAQGKNILVDSSMKNDAQFNRYKDAISSMSDQQYHSTMILIDATKEESIEHATGRYQRGGRFIPLSNIENMQLSDDGKTPSRVTFDNNSDKVDRAILVNNDREIVSDTGGVGGGDNNTVVSSLGSPSDGEEFSKNFEDAFANNPYTAFVNHYTPEEIQDENMKPLTANDGKTGLLIHDHGDGRIEATALYNVSGIPGAGRALLQDSVANHGVNYVECFGDGLKTLYQTVGFQVDTTSSFDPQFAPENWNYEKFGTPNYYTMKTPT